ncbi:4-hydroxy-tetrahydrodipicolinate synthase [Streptomyces gilvosporeus]|uniref:4-hydroxy-tetrahydrodipicolinate synthase n=1 Tax=Streptomyces gilvosporeus TaxID=553510 RepID=A0A1V0U242_9ACTN|nr:4-hydroxy-tetrahydrodipicolinate synthase [Streptomyces gilvosporeus]ARF59100.1 4-hydroxy-tetrahydrodipicolinate synthase [Streptomyces gilvosporeus]
MTLAAAHRAARSRTAVGLFGQNITAMVTPFRRSGGLDFDAAIALAAHLVDEGCDGLVLNGTTGEAPVTSDKEKRDLVREIVRAVGARARVTAGIGTNDTRHSLELAAQAADAGAHGLLAVTPYFSHPAQEGVVAHFTALAEATELPMMLHDIPFRTGIAMAADSFARLAEHPRIVAVQDARGDLPAGSAVMRRTGLAYYCGEDPLSLPWLSVGASGLIGVAGHVAPRLLHAMIRRFAEGDTAGALDVHQRLCPLFQLTAEVGGVPFAKAALAALGRPVGVPRLPHLPATKREHDEIEAVLTELFAHPQR